MNYKKLYLITLLPCYLVTCFFTGCSVDYQFKKAEKLKENGKFRGAIKKYGAVIEKNPENPRLPEAIYNIGKIYHHNLEDNPAAKKYYKKVMNEYPETEWAELSKDLFLKIADYFPLIKNLKWIEVDSSSSGRYMLAKNEIVSVQDNIFKMTRKLYARDKLISSFKKYFKKTKDGIYETNRKGEIIKTVLLFPVEAGRHWTDGRIKYTVISRNENISVIAGNFSDCVKIKKQLLGASSWSYEYYAPEVGKILTTQSAGGREKRITELKEFYIPEDK